MMMTAWTLCMFNLLGLEVLSSKAVHLRVEVKNPEYARGMTVENLDIQRPKSSALEIYADALSCLWRKAGRSEDALLCAIDPASCASTAACTVARARRGPFRRRLQLRFRCGHLALQHALPEHRLLHRHFLFEANVAPNAHDEPWLFRVAPDFWVPSRTGFGLTTLGGGPGWVLTCTYTSVHSFPPDPLADEIKARRSPAPHHPRPLPPAARQPHNGGPPFSNPPPFGERPFSGPPLWRTASLEPTPLENGGSPD